MTDWLRIYMLKRAIKSLKDNPGVYSPKNIADAITELEKMI